MNTVESYSMTSPSNKTEECAKFVIDDTSQVFAINDVMMLGREYTYSGWIRSEVASGITVENVAFSSTTEWAYIKHTFIADSVDLYFAFMNTGTYYIYHAQLELGNKATDWSVSPDDTDVDISNVGNTANTANANAALAGAKVEDLRSETENRIGEVQTEVGTLRTDTENGFNETNQNVQDLSDTTDQRFSETNDRIDGFERKWTNYIDMSLDETDPYIELGQRENNDFKLKITNKRIQFLEGGFEAAYITGRRLVIKTAFIDDELQIGGFVWTEHGVNTTTGISRVGLLWKGGS